MEQATFLGTPLTKYEIDDIEAEDRHYKVRSYYESKGLIHKHTRERIRKNQHRDLYTVDTEEGWTPSHFKSSITQRATYTKQRVDNFTDVEDADIISKEVLKGLDLCNKNREISRIVKSILHANGMLKKKAFGPQLPNENVEVINYRSISDFRGVGFYSSIYDENDEGNEKMEHLSLKWVPSEKVYMEQYPESKRIENPRTSHRFDRDIDLRDIKNFYDNLYEQIVKPLELTQEEEIVTRYARKIEFTQDYREEKPREKEKIGRTIEKYEFSSELLKKFKIKHSGSKQHHVEESTSAIEKGDQEKQEIQIPMELFKKIFCA
ncbi:G patch domain-containing protein [Babesia duncani]|uniref:G patch domain-containing protein n=1 Tax=Babesia duncani TaxID=323732 RepID=A0AAD9PK54_9APIC|nr:G patch domain-containing protein [Babesia duncani]